MLRDCIKNSIYGALNFDVFRYEDFIIEIIDNNYNNKICIKYDDYYCNMEFNGEPCEIKYSPGKVLIEESSALSLSKFENNIKTLIQEWLKRIKRDMINPLEKRFVDNSIQKFREEIESKLCEMEDGYFTKDEGNELRERLKQLEKMISERDSQEELQAEILRMKGELEFLKATIDTLTKKKWLKNALVKMWVWGQKEENQKLIESGFEAVKTISQMDIPKL